ncbi:unnamed protein product [Ilex paraguariensis]|uniref:50S ribosomal protein L19, chloroplastic n=1 Tax=Ilex paraguariensis TaxID=185542 RepID=A0ABC8UV76_9AQUA
MGSNVVPQALFMIHRKPTQWPMPNLGFSSFVSRASSSFGSTPVLTSIRVSVNSFGSSFDPLVSKLANRSFIVRAEADPGTELEVVENVEENVVVVESEAEEAELLSEAEAEEKPPRKPRVKLGEIMGILNKRAIEASDKERPTPDLRTGDIVEIKLEVPENRRRLSIYKGIVISKQNSGIHTTIRIRRIIAGIGVEIVFPIYSPNIKEIKVVKHRKVRRARLYYLRDKLPRLSTFK